jgi:hypothetical protein
MDREPFGDISRTHEHEESLWAQSMTLARDDPELSFRLSFVERAIALVFGFTIEHVAQSEDETTTQLIGVRLFNAAAAGLKLAFSGYYQPAFHQLRDVMEIGFLLDYFRTSPSAVALWRKSDAATRKKLFSPAKVRMALDARDGDTTKKRADIYDKLSGRASHVSPEGFAIVFQEGSAQLGPFFDRLRLLAWLEEALLRLVPTAVVYTHGFPGAEERLLASARTLGTEFVNGFEKDRARQNKKK